MPLDEREREAVVRATVDILRHKRRDRLLAILEERLDRGDYDDEAERSLDEIVLALASAIDERLRDPAD